MKKKVVKKERDPELRPNKLDTYIMQALNLAWWKFPARNDVKKEARVKLQDGLYKNGNAKYVYKFRCEACKELHDKVDVDHKVPKSDLKTGFTTLDDYCLRTFCETDGLQVLCKTCHSKKTSLEATERAAYRRERKENKGL